MTITVKLFALARDLAGTGEVSLELPPAGRVADLKRQLSTACPGLAPLVSRLLVAVGNDYAADDKLLEAGADVACFPPVSGG
jgi:molybdopterin converting factor small subunit